MDSGFKKYRLLLPSDLVDIEEMIFVTLVNDESILPLHIVSEPLILL